MSGNTNKATTRGLGDITIGRAVELLMEFDPFMFFPDTGPEDWEPHKSWLMPSGMDPVSGNLLLPCQSYIVRTSHHTILIDSCIGNHKERSNRPAWHEKTDQQYMKALDAHGVTPEDIDYVMCTHLHGDHIGWNTRLVDGHWVPTFPNATYIFSEKELDAWQNQGHEKFSDQPLVDSVLPVVAAGQAQLVGNDYSLDDEIWVEPTPGHTPDHLAIRLSSHGQNAVMTGDMMHTPVQCLHPEWAAWPDWDAKLASETRVKFMQAHADTDMLVCTAHFPLPSAGRIVSSADGFRFVNEDAAW